MIIIVEKSTKYRNIKLLIKKYESHEIDRMENQIY